MNTLNSLKLDDEVEWLDELDWTPVEQTLKRGQTGKLVVQEGIKTGGRYLTLRFISKRSQVEQFMALLVEPAPMALTLYGTGYAVKWRHADKPIDATPDVDIVNPAEHPELGYTVTLRLIEV